MTDDPGRAWLRRHAEVIGLGETADDPSQLDEMRANFAPLDALWRIELGDTEPALVFDPRVSRQADDG
jgi:hypothetical protein